MTSFIAIISLIALLVVLLSYAFISQSLMQKRQQRERLIAGLKSRLRSFQFILNGFPDGFLPRDLLLLVQRSLMHVLEQLCKLDAENLTYQSELNEVTQKMAETQRLPQSATKGVSLSSSKQASEIRACLEELYKYVFNLESNGKVTRAQADTYRQMVKNLLLQLTLDNYEFQARISLEKNKLALALHIYRVILQLMVKESGQGQFEKRITKTKEMIDKLEKESSAAAPSTPSKEPTDESSNEWDSFKSDGDSWKKKQIYD